MLTRTIRCIPSDMSAKKTRTVINAIRRGRETPWYSIAHLHSYVEDDKQSVTFCLRSLLTINQSAPQLVHFEISIRFPWGRSDRRCYAWGDNHSDYVHNTDHDHECNIYQQKVPHMSRDVVWSFQEERNIRKTEGKHASVYHCRKDDSYHP